MKKEIGFWTIGAGLAGRPARGARWWLAAVYLVLFVGIGFLNDKSEFCEQDQGRPLGLPAAWGEA